MGKHGTKHPRSRLWNNLRRLACRSSPFNIPNKREWLLRRISVRSARFKRKSTRYRRKLIFLCGGLQRRNASNRRRRQRRWRSSSLRVTVTIHRHQPRRHLLENRLKTRDINLRRRVEANLVQKPLSVPLSVPPLPVLVKFPRCRGFLPLEKVQAVLDDRRPLSHRQAPKVALITHPENSPESLVRRVLLIPDFLLCSLSYAYFIYITYMCLRHMTPIDYFGLMVMLLIATDFCENLLDEWWMK